LWAGIENDSRYDCAFPLLSGENVPFGMQKKDITKQVQSRRLGLCGVVGGTFDWIVKGHFFK
jgi:hypothetical protein